MMKLLRLMMRERSACSDCDFTEPALRNFTRMLLKPTEHTWGLHGAGQGKIWDNALLQVREKTAAEFQPSFLLAVPSLSWQSIVFHSRPMLQNSAKGLCVSHLSGYAGGAYQSSRC